ncbi:FG-GAP-like repeat-containing protein [Aquimarina sp. Aq107]|uniref:FG-GAP-like repeat-containing protein n=1 Tax=Aquimarina sp. Aq107 TaxID=1191912 RepID=UPI000D55EEC1|nr:FG-GAP-like repeat-containing protein [Aquimarina sp. Aq107]
MNYKYPVKDFFIVSIITFILIPVSGFAQIFERIETISGLDNLRRNNGVSVADYDQDNDLDIFVVALEKDDPNNENSKSKLFRNNNDGTFDDVTIESGLVGFIPISQETPEFDGLTGDKFGAYWGDYDNDGYPDIFFTQLNRIQLFHNNGDGTFTDVTEMAGFEMNDSCGNTNAAWFDFDNDSFLDLFISDWRLCSGNKLFKNNGDGTFTNVTQTMIAPEDNLSSSPSYTAFPFDFNEDGWMDLYIANDLIKPNTLLINQGGTSFVGAAQTYGLASSLDDMGICIGDINNNGDFDFLITAISKNVLLTNNGDNTFNNTSDSYGITGTGWSWGNKFADFDLDGDEDLFIVNGYNYPGYQREFNVYFENTLSEGREEFRDFTRQVGLRDIGYSTEGLDFDYDNDGDLDILVTNTDAAPFFYENKILNFDQENPLNWFKISLEGTTSNRDAFGTILTIKTNNDTFIRYHNGVGFLGQNIKPVHFGLNESTEILELIIKWPSGLEERYENLTINTIIKATEGNGYQTLNISPSIKIKGCTDPNSCNYNPLATTSDGSCEYLTSSDISGETNPSFLSTQTYTLMGSSESTFNWGIEGGELLNGQGTNSISVRWGLETTATVNVVEISNECSSREITLEINLNGSDIPEDISVARLWNETLLSAIRGDFARPTVHARNLFHTSVAMYDAWAVYDEDAKPYLIGNTVHNFVSSLDQFFPNENIEDSRNKAISYAVYRVLTSRFRNSPSASVTKEKFDFLMDQLGYDINITSTNYQDGDAAALGNYIGEIVLSYGNTDNSNEINEYGNQFYSPINTPLAPIISGNPVLEDPNRWQPLSLDTFIDQSGNLIEGTTPTFLSPEWGNVLPFALNDQNRTQYERSGNQYTVYHDPSAPPYLNTESSENYKWGFSMVSVWGAHLDQKDGVMLDISPNSLGNQSINSFPTSFNDFDTFYNYIEGGDQSKGYNLNPYTNAPYESQIVPRGDYARVLAEFWADGPDSETPPGHWFTILNYINDNPLLIKKLGGEGNVLNSLEWDVKAYFILGGTMHDAAISAWSIKGWYDYIRPISAVRYMASKGQSSDSSLPNYNLEEGIPLVPGYIELVTSEDPLSGINDQHVDKIKLYTWKGPDYISNPEEDQAGVGWILAENFWPYQRPSFVTPPFAGYVSGHSTYSRAAAETLTLLTGNEFFPGGYGEFIAKKDEFLVFEQGPSVDIKLQWATYRDASDQCSLSRIWGGIHPPADDLPGRFIGEKIGKETYNFAVPYFSGKDLSPTPILTDNIIFPNPTVNGNIFVSNTLVEDSFELFDITGKKVYLMDKQYAPFSKTTRLIVPQTITSGIYLLRINNTTKKVIINK